MNTLNRNPAPDDVNAALIEPNFFVIGASKSGTTSLHDYLSQHPDIFMPGRKELRFFSNDGNYGDDGYKQYLKTYFTEAHGHTAVGEATPGYLLHGDRVVRRMLESISDPSQLRFIAVFREPVDRAISHYLHARRLEVESRSFEEAVLVSRSPMRVNRDCVYLRASAYAENLRPWLARFPRSAFLFLQTEDLQNVEQIRRIFRFLNVAEDAQIALEARQNIRAEARSRALMHLLNSDGALKRAAKRLFPPLLLEDLRLRFVRLNERPSRKVLEVRPEVIAALTAEMAPSLTELEQQTGLTLSNWKTENSV